jgi:hypothetical protein
MLLANMFRGYIRINKNMYKNKENSNLNWSFFSYLVIIYQTNSID